MPQTTQTSSGGQSGGSPRNQSANSITGSSASSLSLGNVQTLPYAPPRKSSQPAVLSPVVGSSLLVPPQSVSGTTSGLTASFSVTNVSNAGKSMATLDPQKMSREAIDPGAYRGGAWQALCQKVLPLFNGQGLKGHMEDLNDLVSNWLSDTPANVVVDDLNDLFTTGMMVLGNKIVAVADEALAGRLVEVWSFYFGTVVPYIQGVFLPVRTSWRTSGNRTGEPPNVREMSLVSFRDHIIAPLGGRLTEIFPRLVADIENGRKMNDTATRLMQMLYVLDGMRALIQDGDDPIAAVLRQRKRGGLHEVVI